MLVEQLQGSLVLLDSDELLRAFAAAALVGRRQAAAGGAGTEYSQACCGGAAPCWAAGDR
jgi:hypothetical protein